MSKLIHTSSQKKAKLISKHLPLGVYAIMGFLLADIILSIFVFESHLSAIVVTSIAFGAATTLFTRKNLARKITIAALSIYVLFLLTLVAMFMYTQIVVYRHHEYTIQELTSLSQEVENNNQYTEAEKQKFKNQVIDAKRELNDDLWNSKTIKLYTIFFINVFTPLVLGVVSIVYMMRSKTKLAFSSFK